MNQANLMGRLTADPELRTTTNGTPVCNVTLAVNDAKNEEADYFPIVVWGKKAEALAQYMHKGEKIVVLGYLKNRHYINNDNKVCRITEVIANEVYFAETNRTHEPEPKMDSSSRTKEEWAMINEAMSNVPDAPF